MYFDGNLIYFKQSFDTRDELFHFIAKNFQENGYVNEKFENGIKEREKNYPTGLVLGKYCVAIPHTDADKVIKPQLQFITLAKPVKFYQMADNKSEIGVDFVVSLALKEPHAQLEMLQKLMGVFSNSDLLDELMACEKIADVKRILKEQGIE